MVKRIGPVYTGSMAVPNAIDLSFSKLDTSQLSAALKLVIQNVWTGAATPGFVLHNIIAAKDAGKRVGAYCVINPHVADNVAHAIPYQSPEFCALDCELYDDLTPAKVRAESDRLAAARPAWPRIIYTSRGYWQSVMGDCRTFAADHWLWDARPGDNLPYVPYGGWDESRVIGVQRTSTITLGKTDVDLDEWRFDLMDAEKFVTELRLKMASAALNNDMTYLVNLLVLGGMLPVGTAPARPSL